MMSFALEAWSSEDKSLGPNIVAYVKRVHERFVAAFSLLRLYCTDRIGLALPIKQ